VTGREGIFPVYDYPDAQHRDPIQRIASRLGLSEDELYRLAGSIVPEWEVPRHLDAVKGNAKALNKAASHAVKLLESLRALSVEEEQDLRLRGCITPQQIEHLAAILRGDAADLMDWLKRRGRQGGRNPAPYLIAELVRRAFRRLRRPITFGEHDGGPSTDFCREVEAALGDFGIRAHWKDPSGAAHKKQQAIEHRRLRMATRRQTPRGGNEDSR
jgi:hypothetical protein